MSSTGANKTVQNPQQPILGNLIVPFTYTRTCSFPARGSFYSCPLESFAGLLVVSLVVCFCLLSCLSLLPSFSHSSFLSTIFLVPNLLVQCNIAAFVADSLHPRCSVELDQDCVAIATWDTLLRFAVQLRLNFDEDEASPGGQFHPSMTAYVL